MKTFYRCKELDSDYLVTMLSPWPDACQLFDGPSRLMVSPEAEGVCVTERPGSGFLWEETRKAAGKAKGEVP